jgi:hypothetical protein
MNYESKKRMDNFIAGVKALASEREALQEGINNSINNRQYDIAFELIDACYKMSMKIYVRGQIEELLDELKKELSLIDILTNGIKNKVGEEEIVTKKWKIKNKEHEEEKEPHYTKKFTETILYLPEELKHHLIDLYKEQPLIVRQEIMNAFFDKFSSKKVETSKPEDSLPEEKNYLSETIENAYEIIKSLESIPEENKDIELTTFEFEVDKFINQLLVSIENKYANQTEEEDAQYTEKISKKLDGIIKNIKSPK